MGLTKIPASMLQTDVTVILGTGQDPYGNTTGLTISGKCYLVEKTEQRLDAEKRLVTLSGSIYMDGDIAPSLSVIEGGTVTINGRTWNVYAAERPRGPSKAVHHTKLYLR